MKINASIQSAFFILLLVIGINLLSGLSVSPKTGRWFKVESSGGSMGPARIYERSCNGLMDVDEEFRAISKDDKEIMFTLEGPGLPGFVKAFLFMHPLTGIAYEVGGETRCGLKSRFEWAIISG